MNYSQVDAGKAFQFYIRSFYPSISAYARKIAKTEDIKGLFEEGEDITEAKVRAKLEWIIKRREFSPELINQLRNFYNVDPHEFIKKYADAKGISITGDNNVTHSQDTTISIGGETEANVFKIENELLKKENEWLKRQIEIYKNQSESDKDTINSQREMISFLRETLSAKAPK